MKRARGLCGLCNRRHRLTKAGVMTKHNIPGWKITCQGTGSEPVPTAAVREVAAKLCAALNMGRPHVTGRFVGVLLTLGEAHQTLKVRAEYAAQIEKIKADLAAKKLPAEVPHPLGG